MRKLGWFTVGVTYFLMFWGNLVSATGSGLGCPDWPTCHGTMTPPMHVREVFYEWGHRLIAATASVLIITLVYRLLRSSESENALRRSGKFLLGLLGFQVVLGGVTVLLGLSIAVSTIHLLVATTVFSGLIAVASVVTWKNDLVVPNADKVRRLAVAGLSGMIVQIALGALVRHGHAGLACPAFPDCLDGFFPVPFTFETFVAFTHRWWGILMLGLFVHLGVASARTAPRLARLGRASLGLASAQVLLGIGTVMSGLSTHSRATHAAVGYALWGVLFLIAVRAGAFRFIWEGSGGEGGQVAGRGLAPHPAG
jgi:heme A synthase